MDAESKTITYEEALKDDCMSTALTELQDKHPEMERDQQLAIALEQCGQSNKEAFDALSAKSAPELVYFGGGAIKALGDGHIGGYLVVWGSPTQRDAYREWFTPDTDIKEGWYPRRPILYHHGLDPKVKGEDIGYFTLKKDATGWYADAQLDMTKQTAREKYQDVLEGKLGWSSGSIPHMVVTGDDGEIKVWPIVEGTLTPSPAEPRRTTVHAIRSAITALEEQASIGIPQEPVAEGVQETGRSENVTGTFSFASLGAGASRLLRRVKSMDMQAVMAALDNAGLAPDAQLAIIKELSASEGADAEDTGMMAEPAPEEEKKPEDFPPVPAKTEPAALPAKPDTVDAKAIARHLLSAMKTAPATEIIPAGGGQKPGAQPRIQVLSKYRDLSAEDMAFYAYRTKLITSKSGIDSPITTEFYREMFDKAQKRLVAGNLNIAPERGNRLLAVKSNELDNTGVAAAASNWVPELWSSDLWERTRQDNMIAGQFRSIEMPSATYDLPLESTDPTVYFVPETTNEAQLLISGAGNPIPDSLMSAGKTTLTVKKLALRVGFSSEMEEDSIIPWLPQVRQQSLRTMQNAIDNVLVNGDTETGASANINDIDGTPAATAKYLVFNGLRKLGLVTNTAVSVNANGGAIDLTKIRAARFKMTSTTNTYATRPEDLVIFTDVQTYGKMLNIDELLSYMNNGRGSTVNDGRVPNIDGIPVYASFEIPLANTAGKVSETAGNNTLGTLVIAAKPAWYIGYKRQVTLNVDYISYYDAYQLTATVRIAFVNKDTVAAATIYNISVA